MEKKYFRDQIFKVSLLSLTALFFATGVSAQGQEITDKGRKIFIEKRCYTCHTVKAEEDLIEAEKKAFAKARGLDLEASEKSNDEDEDGKDDKKGGDLSHVGKERETAWIRDFIQKPKNEFKDSPDCKRKAKKKDRKRFKGTEKELETLVNYISGLKYPEQEKKSESCLKEKVSKKN